MAWKTARTALIGLLMAAVALPAWADGYYGRFQAPGANRFVAPKISYSGGSVSSGGPSYRHGGYKGGHSFSRPTFTKPVHHKPSYTKPSYSKPDYSRPTVTYSQPQRRYRYPIGSSYSRQRSHAFNFIHARGRGQPSIDTSVRIQRPHRADYERYMARLEGDTRRGQDFYVNETDLASWNDESILARVEPAAGPARHGGAVCGNWNRAHAACKRDTTRWMPWMGLYN